MLVTQKQYIDFLQFIGTELDSVTAKIAPRMDSIRKNFTASANDCAQAIKEVRLFIPVIGAFSAGKSSLLNALIGEPLLAVAITPETALATELYFDKQARIEAITTGGEIKTFEISQFHEVTSRAAEFEYLRVYSASTVLKEIEPLILVDMPGFDSPLDTHRKAIANFIDRGAYYVVLVSVEEGTLTTQVINRLRGVLDHGREFNLCLSKADLKPPAQVHEIANYIGDQLETQFNLPRQVVVLDQDNGAEKAQALVKRIDPNHLIRNLFHHQVKGIFFSLDADINTLLATLGKDAKELKEAQEELQSALQRLEHEKNDRLQKLRERSDRHIEPVLSSVKQRLDESVDQLAQSAMSGGQKDLSRDINEIVQGALAAALRREQGKMVDKAVVDFSSVIKGNRDNVSVSFELPKDMEMNWIEQMKSPLADLAMAFLKNNKWLGPVLAGGAALKGPVSALLGAFLPSVIGSVLESIFGSRKDKQKQEIIDNLHSKVFPLIITKLRIQVENHISEMVQAVIEAVVAQYEEHLSQQRQILAEAGHPQKLANLEEHRQEIQAIQSIFRDKAESFLFAS